MQRHGDYSQVGDFHYREMEMEQRGSEAKKDYLLLDLYRLLAAYSTIFNHPVGRTIFNCHA